MKISLLVLALSAACLVESFKLNTTGLRPHDLANSDNGQAGLGLPSAADFEQFYTMLLQNYYDKKTNGDFITGSRNFTKVTEPPTQGNFEGHFPSNKENEPSFSIIDHTENYEHLGSKKNLSNPNTPMSPEGDQQPSRPVVLEGVQSQYIPLQTYHHNTANYNKYKPIKLPQNNFFPAPLKNSNTVASSFSSIAPLPLPPKPAVASMNSSELLALSQGQQSSFLPKPPQTLKNNQYIPIQYASGFMPNRPVAPSSSTQSRPSPGNWNGISSSSVDNQNGGIISAPHAPHPDSMLPPVSIVQM